MESLKTFHGYDSDGNCIKTSTAEDANNYINPVEVQKALDNLKSVLEEQFKAISDALRGIEADANEAIIVQGTNMSGTIEETCNALDSIPNSIMGQLGELHDKAIQAHDRKQRELNESAYKSTWVNNVVRVS